MKDSELLAYLKGEFAKLAGVLRDLEERMPPLTAAQRSARIRERRKSRTSHAPETEFSEEKVTHGATQEERTEPPPLPVPSPSPSVPTSLSPFIPLPLEKAKAMSSELDVVFGEWQRVMNHPDAKFTDERKRKVRARLAEGYSVDRIVAAIHGCKRSPHHQGHNENGTKYDDLELICRNGTKLEMFEAHAPKASVVALAPKKSDGQLLEEAYAEAEAKNGRF